MKSGNYSVKYFRSGKRAKSKSAWGLEIGDSELKATKVKLHNGKLLVEAIDRVEISTMNQSAATTNAEIVENAINNFVTRNEIEKSEKNSGIAPCQDGFIKVCFISSHEERSDC